MAIRVPTAGSMSGGQRPAAVRYPPVLFLLVGVLVSLLVLPSALNLPQTSPTETAEYAPVPPTDHNNPPPGGNLAQVGLGGSNTLGGEQTGENPASTDNGPAQGGLPTNPGPGQNQIAHLRCVNTPSGPRQTEDPLSPPCEATYVGDNGGSTYQGVTATEVRVLVYIDGNTCGSFGFESTPRPNDTYYDFDQPPSSSSSNPTLAPESQSVWAEPFRALDNYLNQHYQFYHRHIHMRLWHGRAPTDPNASCLSPSEREADAQEQYSAFHPFAVLNLADANSQYYDDYMNQHGVLTFISESRLTSNPAVGAKTAAYQQYPGLIWSYLPSMESNALWYSKFVCLKVKGPSSSPYTAVGTTDPLLQGKPRKFGLVEGNDESDPGKNPFYLFGQMVKSDLKSMCGIDFGSDVEDIPVPGYNIDETGATHGDTNAYAQEAMAQFKQDGVTTVIWAGGEDDYTTKAAQGYGYFPEWVVFGDRQTDANVGGDFEVPTEYANAWTVSSVELYPNEFQQQCYLAYQESDPNASAPGQTGAYIACQAYPDLRLIGTGLQVAGPHLTPKSMDEGFHAMPHVSLNSPYAPTCYFNPGDYTCIKDMDYEWWDNNTTPPDPGANPGCWRMIEGGKRWLEGNWQSGEFTSYKDTAKDPCNDYT